MDDDLKKDEHGVGNIDAETPKEQLKNSNNDRQDSSQNQCYQEGIKKLDLLHGLHLRF
jgi:hypothetical protein